MTEQESDMCWDLLLSIAVLSGQLHPSDHKWHQVPSNEEIQKRLSQAGDKFINRWKELDPEKWKDDT